MPPEPWVERGTPSGVDGSSGGWGREFAEAFVAAGVGVAEDAGEEADGGVEDDGGGEFAAGEDVVADGEFFVAEEGGRRARRRLRSGRR
jgi:hypothetical protein